jgi:tetratricopeptide (TPR) repeat protein
MYLERFEDARSDLVRIEREFSLDTPNMYNKYICEGILSCNTDKYEQALAYFSKAEKTRPSRLEPNFYKAVALIRFSSKLIPKEMVDKKQEYLQSAMKTISKVDKIPENNPSLCLIRGLLKFSLGDVESSIVDFDTSIHDCSPPKAVSFYLKGLALATLGRIDEAAHEFNNASAHDEKHEYPEIYLNRAKCTLLRG